MRDRLHIINWNI